MTRLRRILPRRRAATLEQRAGQAAAEAERSRQRAEAIREKVVAPLAEKDSRNQFADLIRASLIRNGSP